MYSCIPIEHEGQYKAIFAILIICSEYFEMHFIKLNISQITTKLNWNQILKIIDSCIGLVRCIMYIIDFFF